MKYVMWKEGEMQTQALKWSLPRCPVHYQEGKEASQHFLAEHQSFPHPQLCVTTGRESSWLFPPTYRLHVCDPCSFPAVFLLGLELYLFVFFLSPLLTATTWVFLPQKSFLNSVPPIRQRDHSVHTWHCGQILPLIYSMPPSLPLVLARQTKRGSFSIKQVGSSFCMQVSCICMSIIIIL